jgi:hypothetical protein
VHAFFVHKQVTVHPLVILLWKSFPGAYCFFQAMFLVIESSVPSEMDVVADVLFMSYDLVDKMLSTFHFPLSSCIFLGRIHLSSYAEKQEWNGRRLVRWCRWETR